MFVGGLLTLRRISPGLMSYSLKKYYAKLAAEDESNDKLELFELNPREHFASKAGLKYDKSVLKVFEHDHLKKPQDNPGVLWFVDTLYNGLQCLQDEIRRIENKIEDEQTTLDFDGSTSVAADAQDATMDATSGGGQGTILNLDGATKGQQSVTNTGQKADDDSISTESSKSSLGQVSAKTVLRRLKENMERDDGMEVDDLCIERQDTDPVVTLNSDEMEFQFTSEQLKNKKDDEPGDEVPSQGPLPRPTKRRKVTDQLKSPDGKATGSGTVDKTPRTKNVNTTSSSKSRPKKFLPFGSIAAKEEAQSTQEGKSE